MKLLDNFKVIFGLMRNIEIPKMSLHRFRMEHYVKSGWDFFMMYAAF